MANRVTNKLYKITNNIYSCRSGSAADTQAISDIVSYHLGFHRFGNFNIINIPKHDNCNSAGSSICWPAEVQWL